MIETCGTCRFFGSDNIDGKYTGTCWRHPPSAAKDADRRPVVNNTEWCGDWETKSAFDSTALVKRALVLGVRVKRALDLRKISTFGELYKAGSKALLSCPGFGSSSLLALQSQLRVNGYPDLP